MFHSLLSSFGEDVWEEGGSSASDGFCPELHLDEAGYEGEQKTSLCE